MRSFAIFAAMLLAMPALVYAANPSALFGGEVGQKLPSPLDQLFGNERSNVYVTETDIVVGVVTKDAKVAAIEEGGVENPTVNVFVSQETLDGLVSGELTYKEAVSKGLIKIQGVGLLNSTKFMVLEFVAKILLIFS
ncbi:MAG: hypothetical protein HYS81_01650 [Candidatus Aenigmatarchaeota archaeon]|nr:MAG: hypothetical protein HYS81_01650 [Candidatus Aenigmarchaeota archaeon]